MGNVQRPPKDRHRTSLRRTFAATPKRSGPEHHLVTPEDLARFYRSNGQRVVRTEHAHWYTPSSTAWSIFPYREYPDVDQRDYAQLWRAWRGAVVARTVQTDPGDGTPFHENRALYICAIEGYDLANLSSNTRSKIRRGLSANEIRRADFDELARDGASLHESTLRRQGRRVPADARQQWERTCTVAGETGPRL